MRIEAIDIWYLAMPTIEDIGDGSQDVALVRVRAGGYEGWGECESSPLPTIAALVCPMSSSGCKPVQASVLGQTLETPDDIRRIQRQVRENSFDLLQASHTLSGVDVALWDLLGQRHQDPVWRLLGYDRADAKQPYASVLFGDTPQATLSKAQAIRTAGYGAAKFGWGPFGKGNVQDDTDQIMAAREGLGPEGILLIDAGTIWYDDLERAAACLPALEAAQVTWLEEPFETGALDAYHRLAQRTNVGLAGGEGSHNAMTARHMIDYGGLSYVQIDAGRVGGITAAKQVADYAMAKGVTFVNHTFTSHLALSASLQAYAGQGTRLLCEYPIEIKPMAWELTGDRHIVPNSEGLIELPQEPGLGLRPCADALKRYALDVEMRIGEQVIYRTPTY